MRRRNNGTFPAVGAVSGRQITIQRTVQVLDGETTVTSGLDRQGVETLKTADGVPVRRLAKGRYWVSGQGEVFLSEDPDAQ